ncbi:MAG: Zn-ribbon domain-containing OB-fold protein [Acidimicrobiaceae bacterium]|nr:Zn-ribbon domain-containing OB-fold protein [Acidimicrobiaceae bacterium]MCY3642799.1 Zn-ribbon domain-containing OB-fold protein [Acidimicrobiaceae bacterium]MDE0666732.1 Zn-ribbon domain-containing OB-fold protein [Acidimicrobiaceae bacterium]
MPARFEPRSTEVSEPFWRATRERRLIMQWCRPCEHVVFYPREVCPRCLGSNLEWRDSPGTGTVYAFSVHYRTGSPELMDRTPYVVALVDLTEGARLMTNIVGCDPDDIGVGMGVQVTWELLADGRHLPLFEPSTGSHGDSSRR